MVHGPWLSGHLLIWNWKLKATRSLGLYYGQLSLAVKLTPKGLVISGLESLFGYNNCYLAFLESVEFDWKDYYEMNYKLRCQLVDSLSIRVTRI